MKADEPRFTLNIDLDINDEVSSVRVPLRPFEKFSDALHVPGPVGVLLVHKLFLRLTWSGWAAVPEINPVHGVEDLSLDRFGCVPFERLNIQLLTSGSDCGGVDADLAIKVA